MASNRKEEDNCTNRNPLKILEFLGKDIMHNMAKKIEKKSKEAVKKNNFDIKIGDKAWVLVNTVENQEVEEVFVKPFLTMNQMASSMEAAPEIKAGPPEAAEPTDTLKLCPHEDFLRLSKERAAEIYPIKEKADGRSRLALIICNTEFDHLAPRDGADLDVQGMKGLLESLGYSVDVKEKLTAEGMESALRAFAARPEHVSSDSTFLVLMSHGVLDGVCGTAHRREAQDVLPYDTIFQIFNNRNCLGLRDKPKVIIVQACRGENRGEVWVRDSPEALVVSASQSPDTLEDDAVRVTHVEKDFIAFCSSTPHNVSWRDIRKGSLFITQLVACFQKYSWRCHLEEIFRKVQQSFESPSTQAQMPTVERLSMTRYFYLFPGN
ncbi:caspase-13-like isoform X1 [Nycticebus coucang]|uniref:caspase-13-like isoform X1 n=1 Tax=Nycticebus coucang TaxID=9470 RepID=UPI00234C3AD1|nr:caspase-13-like isoform X1 [Nycticebus coucang]XP_053451477.1 caspase-13-like isoform X1 [Nycticebus coucang]